MYENIDFLSLNITPLENDFYNDAGIVKENGRDRTTNAPFDDDPQNGAAEAKAAMMANIEAAMMASEAALGAISAAIQGAIGKIGSCLPMGTSSTIGEIGDQSTIGPKSDDSNTEDISFMDKLKSIGYGILDGGSRFSSDTRHFLFEFGDKVLKIDMDTPYKEGAKSPRQEEEAMAADVKYHNELRDKAPCKSAFDCTSDLSNTGLNFAALYDNAKGVYSLAKSAKFYAQGKFGQFKSWFGFKPEKPTFAGEGEFLTPKPQEERALIPEESKGIVPKGSEGKITMPKETEGKITTPNEVEGDFKSLEDIKQEQGIKITNKSSSEISIEENSSVGSNGSSGKTPSQRIVTQSSTGGGCFLGDTLVYTENGYKQIKDIHAGEKVYSKDIDANTKELHTVTRVFKNNSKYIVHIKVNDEEIRCTLEHPFWIENRGWVPAKDIQVGDEIETYNRQAVYVSETIIDRLTENIDIYNIEVEEVSTYYVSELNLLVHNDGFSTSGQGIRSNPESTDYLSNDNTIKEQNSEIISDFETKNSELAIKSTSQNTTDNVIQPNQKQISEVNKVKDIKNDLKNSEHPHDYTRPGNYGEMKVDIDLESTGHYERINNDRVTSLDASTHHGIDHVFKNHTPPPDYVIVDSKVLRADSAVNINKAPSLSNTKKYGRQLSDRWIKANLEDTVDEFTANKIIDLLAKDRNKIAVVVGKVDKTGSIIYYKVDSLGNIIKNDKIPERWIP